MTLLQELAQIELLTWLYGFMLCITVSLVLGLLIARIFTLNDIEEVDEHEQVTSNDAT
jgi:hypothetical protein